MFMKEVLLLSLTISVCVLTLAQDDYKHSKTFGLTASLPWVNNYSYYDYELDKPVSKSGFGGLGGAWFYISGKNKFSLNFGATVDLPVPIGPFDYGRQGTRTSVLSMFWELIYHRNMIGRLDLITGMNNVAYRFNFTSYVDTVASYYMSDKTIGVTLGMEYRVYRNCYLAAFYRPAIVSLKRKQYWHLLSLDARFDLNLNKNK
jgi:hypothetical protein